MQFAGSTRFDLVPSTTPGHVNATKNLPLQEAEQRVLDPDRPETKLATFGCFWSSWTTTMC